MCHRFAYLGPSNYGLINYAASIVAFAIPVMRLGFDATLVREYVESPDDDTIAGTSMTINLISSVVCTIAVIGFSAVINVNDSTTIIVCGGAFIFSCLLTNYYNLFDENSFVISSGNWYHMLTGMHFYTSFPVALFWVSLGRFLAEKKFAIESSILWIAGVLFAGLLAVERYFVVKFSLGITDDCYFMLALICPVIFLLVREIGVTIITRLPIREMSVILYVTHGCFGRVVGHLLKAFPINDFIQVLLKMLLSLIVSYVLFLMIRWLKEKKNIKMLEFAY